MARRSATSPSSTPPRPSPRVSIRSARVHRRPSCSGRNTRPTARRSRRLGQEIRDQIEDGGTPDPATIGKAFTLINALEAQVDKTLARNSRERVEAEKYLKSLHGLLDMLQTPAINVLLAGVENRPEATLGDLLTFMNAFNLRFGATSTPRQRQVYEALYPKLVTLRDRIAPLVATTAPVKHRGKRGGRILLRDDLRGPPEESPAAALIEDAEKGRAPRRARCLSLVVPRFVGVAWSSRSTLTGIRSKAGTGPGSCWSQNSVCPGHRRPAGCTRRRSRKSTS